MNKQEILQHATAMKNTYNGDQIRNKLLGAREIRDAQLSVGNYNTEAIDEQITVMREALVLLGESE